MEWCIFLQRFGDLLKINKLAKGQTIVVFWKVETAASLLGFL